VQAAVYDIDGVLVDPQLRLRKARESGDFWKAFLDPSLLVLDKPVPSMIERANTDMRAGRPVILVTGRPERLRQATLDELEGFGLDVEGLAALLMRRDGDKRPAWLVKPDLLRAYVEESGISVGEIYEDELKVAEAYLKAFPSAKVYLVSRGAVKPLRRLDSFFG